VGKTKKRGVGRPRDAGLPARRRAEIVACAIEHFARFGYAGADLDAIAGVVGCSKGTLYNYFPSKEKLFGACVDHVIRGLSAIVQATDNGDALAQVENLVRSFLDYFHSHPQYVELLMRERSDFPEREGQTYMQFRKQRREVWSARFAKLMAAGRFRRMDPDRAVDVMFNLLYGTIFTRYSHRDRRGLKRRTEDLLAILLMGLLADGEKERVE
jgi:AcrR family transcriptional regulator